jgi:3-methyladenine DNA glycosylase/8-oxoguanine DNA glycosylase
MIDEKFIKSSLKKIYAIEKRFELIEKKAGLPDFLPREQGYKALQKTIVGQQLSIASASAIWNRFLKSGFTENDNLSSAKDSELRAVGLSRQKIRYLRSLANSDIKYEELDQFNDENILTLLTSVKGIGLWTAEIYLIFS